MRFAKSLLCGISALTLAAGAAFAGTEQLSGPMSDSEPIAVYESYDVYYISPMTDSMALESSGAGTEEWSQSDSYDVYTIYPVEVVES